MIFRRKGIYITKYERKYVISLYILKQLNTDKKIIKQKSEGTV